jgi:hypothetical protein
VAINAVDPQNETVVKQFMGGITFSPTTSIVTISKNNFTLMAAGDYKFRFSADGLISTSSREITIKNAAAAKLVITRDMPSTISSGLTFSPTLRVQVQDIYDNPVLDSVTTVSATLVSGTMQSISGATASNTLGSSFIDFTNLSLSGATGLKQLRLTATNTGTPINGTFVNTAQFSLASGTAYALSVSATAVSVANRATISDLVIRVVDASGNVIPDSTAQISAAVSGVTLSGTAVRFATDGVATYSGLAVSGPAGSYNLGFSSTGLVAATVSVTVAHGEASYVTITSSATAKNAQALASQPVVKIYDACL